MTDTHTHLYLLEQFPDGGAEAVERALAAGVSHMVFPNVDESTLTPMMALHRLYPAHTSVALGLHPTEVADGWERTVDKMESELEKGGYVAVGEVGIDLYWDTTRKEMQMEAFRRQLGIAGRLRLPVIIHCREALHPTLEAIAEVRPDVPLVFHSFTGSAEDVALIRSVCDPLFGINGVVTFKNAAPLRDALPEIGLERMLLETDSPYLAPVPHRGKRNESSFISEVCDKVASVLGLSPEEVESATDHNAGIIFKI